MGKVIKGRMITVDNKSRRFGQNPTYVLLHVEDSTGHREEPLLFTESDIIRARARAQTNAEDIKGKDWFIDLID